MVTAVLVSLAPAAFAQSANRASHVDFDDQLIQGQVNKGAVHLIERRDADLGSLVKIHKDYRKEILAGVAVAEPDTAPTTLVAAIPQVSAPKAEPAVAPAPAKLAPAPAAHPMPKPSAKAEPKPAKNVRSSKAAKASKLTKSIGGSRVLSRR